MPRNPTREQRALWHLQHEQTCGCRPAPEGLRVEVERLRSAKAGRRAK